MKHTLSIDYQISQARLVKKLTAENNRLRSEIMKLKERNHMTILGTYYFKLASDVVTDTELAENIQKTLFNTFVDVDKKRVITITGHACDTPIMSEMAKAKWGTNEVLSLARANAVLKTLEAAGMNPWQVNIVGVGDTKPVGQDKNLNRRVEVKVEFV